MADRGPYGRSREALDGLKQTVGARAPHLLPAGIISLVWTYIVGVFGLSLLWLILPFGVLLAVLREQRLVLIDHLVHEIGSRVFRQRAFRKAETAEWANILLNRWWACSSESLFETFTSSLNPLLHDFKPSIIDSIELADVQLGGHTPFVKDVSILEAASAVGGCPVILTPENSQVQPDNLSTLPCRHQVIVNATIGFAAPNAQLTFKTKVKTVGAVLAIQLENFHFNAQTQLVLTMDSEAPFPHLTNLSFTFLSKPDVWLNIRVLKGLQIMQLPIIKNWLHSLIMDSLKETLVDPYRYSVDITNKENDSMVSKGDQAAGVLTVVLENQGLATTDNLSCWCSVRVGDQKYKTAVCSSRQAWTSAYSFLCHNPAEESLLVKMLTRKMMRKSTLLEHPTNLSSLAPRRAREDSASSSKRNSVSSDKRNSVSMSHGSSSSDIDSRDTVSRHHSFSYRGGNLSMDVSYSPLKPLSLTTTDEDAAASRSPSPPLECCSGVLYVCMHSARNLLAMDDDGTSDPYCVLMVNRRKVFTSNFQANTLDPTWEQGVEFFTADYRKAHLTFLLYDWDGRVSGDDFLGLATLTLEQGEIMVVRRQLDLRFHLHQEDTALSTDNVTKLTKQAASDSRPTTPDTPATNRLSSAFSRLKSLTDSSRHRFRSNPAIAEDMSLGDVTISVVFRPVQSVALSESTTTMTPPAAEEVADLALQGGLNLARLEGGSGGVGSADMPDHVAFGLATPGVVHITIHRARDLISKDFNGKSDPYCVFKVGKDVRYKTRVIPKTLHPQWEESFTIEYLKDDEKLTVVCFDKDTLSDDALGTIQLDMDMISNCSAGPGWFPLQNVVKGKVQLTFKLEQAMHPFTSSSEDSNAASPGGVTATSSSASNCQSSMSSAASRVDSGSIISGAQLAADDGAGNGGADGGAIAGGDSQSAASEGAAELPQGGHASPHTQSKKSRAGQLRTAGHNRSRSMDNASPTKSGKARFTSDHTPASKQLSGSLDPVDDSKKDADAASGSLASEDSGASLNRPVESADGGGSGGGGLRQRRLARYSSPVHSSSSLSRTANQSHLFFLSGTIIRADGLVGDAGSLELYVKIRLNSRSFFERPQPFSRGPEIYKTRRVKGTLAPEWRETFQVEESAVSSDSLLTIDLKSSSKTTIGTQTMVLEKFMEGLSQKTKWLDMGNGARLELSLACQHAPPSPTGRSSSSHTSDTPKRSGSFFRRQKS